MTRKRIEDCILYTLNAAVIVAWLNLLAKLGRNVL